MTLPVVVIITPRYHPHLCIAKDAVLWREDR